MKALALTLALLPLKSFHRAQDLSNEPTTRPTVQTAVHPKQSDASGPTISVHRGTLAVAVDAQGYFEPTDPLNVRIRPKAYAGELTIKSIVADGAAVKKQEVILELDPEAIDKQIAAAENDDAASHAGLIRAQADAKVGQEQDALAMRMQVDATKRAEDEVKWFQNVDGPNLLLETDLGVKNAKANVDDQQDELNELKKMYKKDDLSTDTADIVVKRAVRSLENAKIALKIQQEHADKVKSYAYPARKQQVLDAATQAEQQLELLKDAQAQTKVLRQTGLRTALANTKASDERLADLKADKQKLTVRAPADGIVLYGQFASGGFQGADEHSLRVGEHIAPQQVVMTFYEPGKLRLHVNLTEAKFFSLHPGTRATVTPVSFPDQKLEGTCDAAPMAAMNTPQGPQYNLTVSCSGVDPRLAPGMRAGFHADTVEAQDVLLVPNSAIAGGSVWVKTNDGCRERRPVVVGKSDGKQTEIKQGLSEGEQIFVEAHE